MSVDWLLRLIGALVVGVVIRDIFHTLWHPQGFGSIARRVAVGVWRASAVAGRVRSRGELAGPLAMLVTVGVWTVLAVVGWALIYVSWMPDGFFFGTSLHPERSSDVVAATYLSVVTLATLGFGDIVPANSALRLLLPLEALIGFVLLTAAISWPLQVYPALGRRRNTALELHDLAASGAHETVATGDPSVAAALLQSATRGVEIITVDLIQYAESYYFRETQTSMSLAANAPYLLQLTASARSSASPDVRRSGQALESAVARLSACLEERHLHTDGDVAAVFAAYASDHRG